MFSSYVIQAAHVLLELDKAQHSTNKTNGLDISDFHIESEMMRPILRRVLRRLMESEYIVISKCRKYLPLRNPREVSLLDLIQLFHGSLCIGEAFDHYISIGMEYLITDEYRRLLEFEAKVKKTLEEQLSGIPISEFTTGEARKYTMLNKTTINHIAE